jgi:hypothetical protein
MLDLNFALGSSIAGAIRLILKKDNQYLPASDWLKLYITINIINSNNNDAKRLKIIILQFAYNS